MAAIELTDLTKRFGDVTAVEDLTLSVERGEVFGFLGPNGAGKSTTINVLLGFLDPSAGSVRALGTDVTEDPRAVRQRTGLLPEAFECVPNLTAREHVETVIATKDADDDPDEVLDRVGLDPDDARRPADDYSTGMHQRMALAVALVGEPDLIVLDEPSAGLDPNGVQLVRDVVREEAERGATVFFSSHILDEVERVSDRVAILQDGRLAAVDAVDSLRENLGMGAVVEANVDVPPAVEPVAAVDGVTDVTVADSTVRVSCATGRAKMPALRRIDDATTVEDVQIEETSLEDLFEAYTAPGERGANATTDSGVAEPTDTEPDARAAPAGGDPS